jgi:PelA/Pel-15E family pectate lyase
MKKLAVFLGAVWLFAFSPDACSAPALRDYLKKPEGWFASEEARNVLNAVLSHQSNAGGWPKNINTTAAPFQGDRTTIRATFDNGATVDELRLLALAFVTTRDERYSHAFERGFQYVLSAQYPTGGWPQSHPPPADNYQRHITFNDGAMVRLMEFVRETFTADAFGFLGQDQKQAAREAFDRGVSCILKCQIKVNGQLTAWCAQHDEEDFRPRPGRSYELVSLSGAESVGIVRLLMSLENPGPDVIRAVESAAAWFSYVKLTGIRVANVEDKMAPRGFNRVVIIDPDAPPIWARFYEIGTNRPIFVDRDGVPKYSLSEIGYERRNGYAWYGSWPANLLSNEYPGWRRQTVDQISPGAQGL